MAVYTKNGQTVYANSDAEANKKFKEHLTYKESVSGATHHTPTSAPHTPTSKPKTIDISKSTKYTVITPTGEQYPTNNYEWARQKAKEIGGAIVNTRDNVQDINKELSQYSHSVAQTDYEQRKAQANILNKSANILYNTKGPQSKEFQQVVNQMNKMGAKPVVSNNQQIQQAVINAQEQAYNKLTSEQAKYQNKQVKQNTQIQPSPNMVTVSKSKPSFIQKQEYKSFIESSKGHATFNMIPVAVGYGALKFGKGFLMGITAPVRPKFYTKELPSTLKFIGGIFTGKTEKQLSELNLKSQAMNNPIGVLGFAGESVGYMKGFSKTQDIAIKSGIPPPKELIKYKSDAFKVRAIKNELFRIDEGKSVLKGNYESTEGFEQTTQRGYNPETKIKVSSTTKSNGILKGELSSSKLNIKDEIGQTLAKREITLKDSNIKMSQYFDTKAGKMAEVITKGDKVLRKSIKPFTESNSLNYIEINDPVKSNVYEVTKGRTLKSMDITTQGFKVGYGKGGFSGNLVETSVDTTRVSKNLRNIKRGIDLESGNVFETKKVSKISLGYGESLKRTDLLIYDELKGKINIVEQEAQPRVKQATTTKQQLNIDYSNVWEQQPETKSNNIPKQEPQLINKKEIKTNNQELVTTQNQILISKQEPIGITNTDLNKIQLVKTINEQSLFSESPKIKFAFVTPTTIKEEKPITVTNTQPKTFQVHKQNLKLNSQMKIRTNQITSLANKESLVLTAKVKPSIKTTQRVAHSLISDTQVAQKVVQAQDNKLITNNEHLTVTSARIKLNPIKPKLKKPLFPLAIPQPKQQSRPNQAYNVYGRRFGKLIKLTSRPLTKQQAVNYGEVWAGTTAGASFKLEKTISSSVGRFSGRGIKRDFYKSKKGFYVEKLGRRIKSRGELREITYKGIASKKKKKSKRGFKW